jgi:phage portal protein BeeE
VVRHARQAYEANGIVFACVAARMALLSEASFKFQSVIDKHLFGNQDLGLLEYPWPNATAGELWARMEQDDSTAGQAYIRKAQPADGTDALLVQMRPDCVTIVSEERRDDQGRTYKIPAGYAEDLKVLGVEREPQFYDVSEVAHWSPVPDPSASFRGMSWLSPVLREVHADQSLTSYKTHHLDNGAMPGVILKYSQKLGDTAVARLKKRFDVLFGGPGNAGRVLVLDEGADATVAGSTLEQLQFQALSQVSEARICAAAQVPLEVVGLRQGDYQAAIRRMADMWARPHWRSGCAALQHLLPDVTPPTRLWFDVSDIAALREGELARGQTVLVKSQAVAAFVNAGYTRDSAVAAADSGDLSQLVADPNAPVPGGTSTATTTTSVTEQVGGPGQRPPQAGIPQDLPGVVKPNLPNAKPWTKPPMPALPNGARGPVGRDSPFGWLYEGE